MAEERKDQGFTKEQLEELQIDSALGGDIPFVGMAGVIGRKTVPKILEAGKNVFKEVYEHYVEGKAAKELAKATSLQELRASLEPLESVFKRGVEEGKLNPKALEKNYKGADLFAKNEDELKKFLPDEQFKNYAKLAIDDEAKYRETLSNPTRFLRAFHYDNANPELGYAMGPVRYGGTYNSHLKAAAADTDLQAMLVMMGSNARGAAQTVVTAVAGVKAAVGAPVEAEDVQNISGERALQAAFRLAPEMKSAAQETLDKIQTDYLVLSAVEKAKFGSEAQYLDAAKRSVAEEIVTMKLDPEAGLAEKASSAVGSLPVETKVSFVKAEFDKMQHLTPEQKMVVNEHLAAIANDNGMSKDQQVTVTVQGQERTY